MWLAPSTEKHMSLLYATMFPENYKHAAESAPRRINLLMTEQRGEPRPVNHNMHARPEIIKLLKEGVLTTSEILVRTEIPKSTVVKTLKDLAREGAITVTDASTKNMPTRHYWGGIITEPLDLTVEQLVQDGVLTFGEMVARSRMARSVIYNTLQSLKQKGLIEIVAGEVNTIPARHYWRG